MAVRATFSATVGIVCVIRVTTVLSVILVKLPSSATLSDVSRSIGMDIPPPSTTNSRTCVVKGTSNVLLFGRRRKSNFSEVKMLKQRNESFYQKQGKARPKLEDVLNDYLDGDNLKNALDFSAWLRANKMAPQYISGYLSGGMGMAWSVIYGKKDGKANRVCHIKLYNDSWHICPSGDYYDDFANDFELETIITSNLNPCTGIETRCTHMCNLGMGHTMTFFGKDFDKLCGGFTIRLRNLDGTVLEKIKKVIESRNNNIAKTS